MTGPEASATRPIVPRAIHRLAIPIILGWLNVDYLVSALVPPLEQVEKERSVSLVPADAPSFQALQRMGVNFEESHSNSVAMIVLEGEQPLGAEAHRYYDDLIRQLRADPAHVQYIQDFWGDPLMAGAVESADGRAVYVQFSLTGDLG